MQIKTAKRYYSHPLGWLKPKDRYSTHEDVEKLESSYTAGRDVKWCSLIVPQKVKRDRLSIWPSNSTLRCLSKRPEKNISNKNLCTNVHSSMIHHSQKVETTQISINWWTDFKNVFVYPYSGILFKNKNEWSTDMCYNMCNSWKHYENTGD